MNKKWKKAVFFGIAAVASALLTTGILYFLPAKVPILKYTKGPGVPFGAITKEHPFEICLSEELEIDPDADRDLTIELKLATYDRINTSHYTFEFYDLDDGKKSFMNEVYFEAADIADNSYKSFDLKTVNAKIAKPCFSLKSEDAGDGNAITIWIGAKNEPFMKFIATTNLMRLFRQTNSQNLYVLQGIPVFLLFFIYLTSLTYFAIYLLTIRDRR